MAGQQKQETPARIVPTVDGKCRGSLRDPLFSEKPGLLKVPQPSQLMPPSGKLMRDISQSNEKN